MDWATHFRKRSSDFGADTATAPINHVNIVEQVIAGVVVLVIGTLSFALFRSEEREIKYLKKELRNK